VGGLLKASRVIDAINYRIGKGLSWLILVVVLVSATNATVRKVFDTSSNAWLELQWVLFGVIFLLCSPWTLMSNEHVRIDIVNSLLPKKLRDLVDVVGHLFFLLPLTIVMVVTGVPFFLRSARIDEQSVKDALRYSVVNLLDAVATIGGFPFDNSSRFYTGSQNDVVLNLLVPRASAHPVAQFVMQTQYQTTGVLQRPLVTLHTLRDQQVPYFHEQLYSLKTLASGAFLTRHVPIAVDRFEHCNFTAEEVLGSFITMLLWDAATPAATAVNTTPGGQQ